MHDKVVLLAKSKLNSIEFLISKALIDSVISHNEFGLHKNNLVDTDGGMYLTVDSLRENSNNNNRFK